MAIEREEIERLAKDRDDELHILDRNVYGRLRDILMGKEVARGPKGLRKGTDITDELLDEVPRSQWWDIALKDEQAMRASRLSAVSMTMPRSVSNSALLTRSTS